MQVWWRDNPITKGQAELLEAVMRAHEQSAYRENLSTTALLSATVGNGSYGNAVAAALLTIGGLHAPVVPTYDLLRDPHPGLTASMMLSGGRLVPGWGSSFVKGGPDSIWQDVEAKLKLFSVWQAVQSVDQVMQTKKVFPNPSCYTAAAAIALGIPRLCAPWLFVAGRLTGWTKLYQQRLQGA